VPELLRLRIFYDGANVVQELSQARADLQPLRQPAMGTTYGPLTVGHAGAWCSLGKSQCARQQLGACPDVENEILVSLN
jgi:hypothetical protein